MTKPDVSKYQTFEQITTRLDVIVDQVRGREEVVIKPLPRAVRGLPGYAGATLIGDGRMALILDVDGLRATA